MAENSKLYYKDGVPVNFKGENWHTYIDMMEMAILNLDDAGDHWEVACGNIDESKLATDDDKPKYAKMQRKIRQMVIMSLSPGLAALYRTQKSGSGMIAALKKRYDDTMNATAVFYKTQRLEEELRTIQYNPDQDIDKHLQRMRNKQIELTELMNPLSSTTMIMYMLRSLPAKVEEFRMIQYQNRCGQTPTTDVSQLEEQIRNATKSYKDRIRTLKGEKHHDGQKQKGWSKHGKKSDKQEKGNSSGGQDKSQGLPDVS